MNISWEFFIFIFMIMELLFRLNYYGKLYSFWAAGPTKRSYDPTSIIAKNILFNVLDTFNTEHHQHIYKLIYIQNSCSHTLLNFATNNIEDMINFIT